MTTDIARINITSLDFQALDLRRLAKDPITFASRNKARSMGKTFLVAWTAILSAVGQILVAQSMSLAGAAGGQEMGHCAVCVQPSQLPSIQQFLVCKWSGLPVRKLGQIKLPKTIVRILT